MLPDRERVLGAGHPHTLTTRHNLAHFLGKAGDLAGAVRGFEELLHDRLRILGLDHPDTLTTRGKLAHWQQHTADEREQPEDNISS